MVRTFTSQLESGQLRSVDDAIQSLIPSPSVAQAAWLRQNDVMFDQEVFSNAMLL